jgi:hypothetical protein
MLHHVAVGRTDILEEHITTIIKVTRIGELGTTLAVTSNRSIPRRMLYNASQKMAFFMVVFCSWNDFGNEFYENQHFGLKVTVSGWTPCST